jgi:hypothetical protein
MADDQSSSHGTVILAKSMREVLMGYQYILHQQKKRLLQEKGKIRRRHKLANATSRILREERSNASYTSGGQHRVPEPNEGNLE